MFATFDGYGSPPSPKGVMFGCSVLPMFAYFGKLGFNTHFSCLGIVLYLPLYSECWVSFFDFKGIFLVIYFLSRKRCILKKISHLHSLYYFGNLVLK